MGTKDRILGVSLDLFNEERDRDHAALDIANAIGISPGNLYYHFKGKDAIISALFQNFEDEILMILSGADDGIRTIDDLWVYNYIILEEIYDFRFFYRNLDTMLQRYPDLAVRFRAILSYKQAAIDRIIDTLTQETLVAIDEQLRPVLRNQILMTMTFWLSYESMQSPDEAIEDEAMIIHKTVFQIMAMVVPYMGEAGFAALRQLTQYYANVRV